MCSGHHKTVDLDTTKYSESISVGLDREGADDGDGGSGEGYVDEIGM